MEKMKYICCLTLLLLVGCTQPKSIKEIYQSSRSEVVDVKDKVQEIVPDTLLLSAYATPYVLNNYLLVVDPQGNPYLLHAFDKRTFKHVGGFIQQGEGPTEMTNIGGLGIDNQRHTIYITDYGKQKIYRCNVDSILVDSSYTIAETVTMSKTVFPADYTYINDTLCIGRFIMPNNERTDYRPVVSKWNMKTGEINAMSYEHPNIDRKRMLCVASLEHKLYAECYEYHDLVTLCDFDGNLKCNIYGPEWEKDSNKKIHYYGKGFFRGEQLYVSYSGKDSNNMNEYAPTMFQVFDIYGNYVKTLNVGRMITYFCYDPDMDRVIMTFNDDMQLGYLDLKGI